MLFLGLRGRRSDGGAIAVQRENDERVQIQVLGGDDDDEGADDKRWRCEDDEMI